MDEKINKEFNDIIHAQSELNSQNKENKNSTSGKRKMPSFDYKNPSMLTMLALQRVLKKKAQQRLSDQLKADRLDEKKTQDNSSKDQM